MVSTDDCPASWATCTLFLVVADSASPETVTNKKANTGLAIGVHAGPGPASGKRPTGVPVGGGYEKSAQ
jgi:hypothetical protein